MKHSIIFVIASVAMLRGEESRRWYVVLNTLYAKGDTKLCARLDKILPDTISFAPFHRCEKRVTRDYIYSCDSLREGLRLGDPEAFIGDSLPEPKLSLWFAVENEQQASEVVMRYGGTMRYDSVGYGPGYSGDYLLTLPQLYPNAPAARAAYEALLESCELIDRGVAYLSHGYYLFFGSHLTKAEADSLQALLPRAVPTRVTALQYLHLDM